MVSFALQEELEKSKTKIKRIKDENNRMKIEIQQIKKIKKIEEEKKLGQLEVERLKTEVQKSNYYIFSFVMTRFWL